MHDVEHHTVCYLRDLLLTPAHQDPAITSFLSCWAFEEMWHGEAIGQVLEAHGEEAGAPRIAALRQAPAPPSGQDVQHHRLGRLRRPGLHCAAHDVGRHQRVDDPGRVRAASPRRPADRTLRELLRRIMKQEGGHIDFYASEADAPARRQPQGAEVDALRLVAPVAPRGIRCHAQARSRLPHQLPVRRYKGADVLARIDRRVDRLPGQSNLQSLDTRASLVPVSFWAPSFPPSPVPAHSGY